MYLFFQIREFLFEMSDDPFEVKLRDNFELLEDEYHESLKRQKMLKDKVGNIFSYKKYVYFRFLCGILLDIGLPLTFPFLVRGITSSALFFVLIAA